MKRMCSLVLVFVMVIGCLSILSGCGSAEWKVDENGLTELLIGGIGPTTGDYANYGLSVKNGAELAIKEINAANPDGINGFKLTFQFEDSQGDPDQAKTAYGKLVDSGMKVSLGGTLSGETAAIVAEAKTDGMLVLTPSGSAVQAISGSDKAFRVCFSDPYQGKLSAQYIADNKLATKVAIFYDSSTDYSTGLRETFMEGSKDKIEIVADVSFTSSTNTDFSAQIDEIAASGAELVFLPIYAQEAAAFLTQAKGKLDSMKKFGCDGLDGLLNKGITKEDAEGVMMLTPFAADDERALTQNFVKNYTDKYGKTPDQFAADAYDAVYAIAAAIKKADITAENKDDFNSRIVAAMTQIKVEGVTGTMEWSADGEPNKTALAMVYKNGEAVKYKPEG